MFPAQVKHIEKGINKSTIHKLFFSGDHVLKGFRIGAVAGMIALTVRNLSTEFSVASLNI